MYKVVRRFTDLMDNGRPYEIGDTYPRPGLVVSEERLEELSSTNNKRGVVLIVNDGHENGPSEAEKNTEEAEAGVNPPKAVESKGKPRKGHRENA